LGYQVAAGEKRKMQLPELEEWREKVYYITRESRRRNLHPEIRNTF
jgi:hypothetical protein